jgi:hypothetical protein
MVVPDLWCPPHLMYGRVLQQHHVVMMARVAHHVVVVGSCCPPVGNIRLCSWDLLLARLLFRSAVGMQKALTLTPHIAARRFNVWLSCDKFFRCKALSPLSQQTQNHILTFDCVNEVCVSCEACNASPLHSGQWSTTSSLLCVLVGSLCV